MRADGLTTLVTVLPGLLRSKRITRPHNKPTGTAEGRGPLEAVNRPVSISVRRMPRVTFVAGSADPVPLPEASARLSGR